LVLSLPASCIRLREVGAFRRATISSKFCYVLEKEIMDKDRVVGLNDLPCCELERRSSHHKAGCGLSFSSFLAESGGCRFDWEHLEKYRFRAACRSDSKNIFEFDHRERVRWGNWGFLI
jgi:hypothetical protein